MSNIYMDHGATTRVRKEAADLVYKYMTKTYGNPSSLHNLGREAKEGLKKARKQAADLLGAKSEEIYFTSGGTESDNWAVVGTALANQNKGKHIITSSIEHHAVLDACKYLEKNGFKITYLPVDKNGLVKNEDVLKAVTDETILITIMLVNNEVGTIQPIKEIASSIKPRGILMHTDAVQGAGKIKIDVKELGVDMLTISSHKIYGPKGVGTLFIKNGTKLDNIHFGGSQEKNKRPGTENIPGIIGFGLAAELAERELKEEQKRLIILRDKLINGICERIEYVNINGSLQNRAPHNVNISIKYIEGEALLLNLDLLGIAASSGSACTSGSSGPSYVLLEMGVPSEVAQSSIRLTLGKENSEKDIDYVLDKLPKIVERLREMSPYYKAD